MKTQLKYSKVGIQLKIFLVCAMSVLFVETIQSANITAGTVNYNVSATSAGGTAYTSADNLTFQGWSPTYTLTEDITVVNLTISQGVTLNLNNFNLTVTGTLLISDNGTITAVESSGTKSITASTFSFGGNTNLNTTGYDYSITNAYSNSSRTLSTNGGNFTVSSGGISLSSSNAWINTGGGNLSISGNLDLTNAAYINVGAGNATIGGNYTIGDWQGNSHIAFTNGNVTIQGSMSIGNKNGGEESIKCTGTGWVIFNGSSLTANNNSSLGTIPRFRQSSSSFTKSGSGTVTISTTFDRNCGAAPTVSAGAFTVSGSTTNAPTTYYSCNSADLSNVANWWTNTNCTGSNPSDFTNACSIFEVQSGHSCTFGTSRAIAGTLRVNGTLTPSAAVVISGTGSLSGTGTLTVTRTSATADFSSQYTLSSITLSSLTVDYANATGSQTISAVNYGNLVLSNTSGTQTAANNLTVAGSLTISAGSTLALGSYNLGTPTSISMALSSQITGSGTITLGGNVTFTGSGAATTIAPNIALVNNRTFTVTDGSDWDDVVFSGIISGAFSVTKEGTGRLRLNGANTYTGATTINAGILYAANATALGTTASGTTVTDGQRLMLGQTISIGAEALSLTGTGGGTYGALDNASNTNTYGGVITLQGATTIGARSGSTLNLTNTITATNQNLTLYSEGTMAISGAITTGSGTLTKTGAGTVTVSGNNTYTGTTTITTGTLQLGAADRISNSSNMVLNGGTFSTGSSSGYSETLGTLNLNNNSIIALGTGDHTLTFANSSAVAWAGSTLTINGWTGTAGSSGTAGKIMVGVGGLSEAQLAKISFAGYTETPIILGTGELVPASPDPTIIVSETTRTGFSYCQSTGPSSSLSYVVSGNNLTADITITAPTNYEVSTDNANFYSSRTLTHSSGTVSNTTIYVRLKSGLSANTYNGEIITHTSTGAVQQDVSCSGTVTPQPVVTIASASQVAAANVEQATSKHAISAFTIAVTTANTTVSQIVYTTTGTYTSTDVSNFKLWYNTSNNLSSASQIGSTISSSLGTGAHTFASLSQQINAGNTGYFWVTTDIAPSAVVTRTIQASAISTGDITFTCASVSGSITAGGLQTIVAASRTTYYSRTTGSWNSNTTWSTEGCGGAAVGVGVYPTATDNVIICNTHTVTANIDVVTTGTVTVNSGGIFTVSDNVEIDSKVTIESGATMNWPTTIEIGANANIMVNGTISAGFTSIVYQDDYDGVSKGKITATGTMAFSQVRSASSTKGGSLKATSITIGTYGQNEVGVDVAFDGPTTITTYMGYGYTYFTNGNLTVTSYNSNNSSSVTTNEFVSTAADLIFTNKPIAKNSSLQTNIDGDIYFNAGFENAFTGTPSTRLIADNVYIHTSIKGEGGTDLYIQANVIQQGNITINQNSNGNIFIQNNFNSNGYSTNFDNTNATFKIEGNSRFDNISGHLNSSASIITLGDSYMKGSGTFGPNDGSIYVGGFLTIETLQVSFQGTAKGYIGGAFTAAQFESGGVYNDSLYNADETIGGSGFHPRNATNDPDAVGGNYISYKGGQITSAAMISNLTAGATVLDVGPENWVLPIELLSFSAYKLSNGVQLEWETASEKNNDFFTIYRSNNGLQFEPLVTISGSGTTNEIHEYSFTDYSIFGGMTYYKLSQTDYDGTVSYSHIISVYEKMPNFELLRFVNSTSSYCMFEIQFADYESINDFMIVNALGGVVYEQIFSNTLFERIELYLKPGVYSLINKSEINTNLVKIVVK